MASKALTLKPNHPSFATEAHALASAMREQKQKLRTVHYKSVLDACILPGQNSDLDAVQNILSAIGEKESHLEALCSRGHNVLEFPWYYVGASLWLAKEGSEFSKDGATLLIAHFARVLQIGGKSTKSQMRRTLFTGLAEKEHVKKKKSKQMEEEMIDETILTSVKPTKLRIETFDVRMGDLFTHNGNFGMFIGRSVQSTFSQEEEDDETEAVLGKKKKQRGRKKNNASSPEKVPKSPGALSKVSGLSSDDDSSSDDEEEIKVTRRTVDPRSYRGKLQAVFLDSLNIEDIDPQEVDLVMPITVEKGVKQMMLLKFALLTFSREACALAALLLIDEVFPSPDVLDKTFLSLQSSKFLFTACGVFASFGNKKLTEELLIRYVLKTKRWIDNAMLRKVVGAAETLPVFPGGFVHGSYFVKRPGKVDLDGRHVKAQRSASSPIVTGKIQMYNLETDQATVVPDNGDARELFRSSQIIEFYVRAGSLADVEKQGVNLRLAFGDKLLSGWSLKPPFSSPSNLSGQRMVASPITAPPLLDSSEEIEMEEDNIHEHVKKSSSSSRLNESSFLSDMTMVTCAEIPSPVVGPGGAVGRSSTGSIKSKLLTRTVSLESPLKIQKMSATRSSGPMQPRANTKPVVSNGVQSPGSTTSTASSNVQKGNIQQYFSQVSAPASSSLVASTSRGLLGSSLSRPPAEVYRTEYVDGKELVVILDSDTSSDSEDSDDDDEVVLVDPQSEHK